MAACAHSPRTGSLESLKPSAESFHQRIRWRDFLGAAELIIPERRQAYIEARMKLRDEKDLTITDFQLEEATLGANGLSAIVTSRIGWVRLPSVSENSELVRSEFVFRDGSWFLARQEGGPFAQELSAPFRRD